MNFGGQAGRVVIDDLHKAFKRSRSSVRAVRGVSISIPEGETVALVGESGSGKSTVARILAGLLRPDAGSVVINGHPATRANWKTSAFRRYVQMVFQNPKAALNPRLKIETILTEPLQLLSGGNRGDHLEAAGEALRTVGMDETSLDRYPRELSGGQQQRVAIARALIVHPGVLILDEPTASLDQSLRSRLLALLRAIQQRGGASYLFISHDLTSVRQIADWVAVMYAGRIVEEGRVATVLSAPAHPYTRALLEAEPNMEGQLPKISVHGDPHDPSESIHGCAFAPRCPNAQQQCRAQQPGAEMIEDEHRVECFFPLVESPKSP